MAARACSQCKTQASRRPARPGDQLHPGDGGGARSARRPAAQGDCPRSRHRSARYSLLTRSRAVDFVSSFNGYGPLVLFWAARGLWSSSRRTQWRPRDLLRQPALRPRHHPQHAYPYPGPPAAGPACPTRRPPGRTAGPANSSQIGHNLRPPLGHRTQPPGQPTSHAASHHHKQSRAEPFAASICCQKRCLWAKECRRTRPSVAGSRHRHILGAS